MFLFCFVGFAKKLPNWLFPHLKETLHIKIHNMLDARKKERKKRQTERHRRGREREGRDLVTGIVRGQITTVKQYIVFSKDMFIFNPHLWSNLWRKMLRSKKEHGGLKQPLPSSSKGTGEPSLIKEGSMRGTQYQRKQRRGQMWS